MARDNTDAPARHGARPRPAADAPARHGARPRGGTIPTVRAPRIPIYTPQSARPVHGLHYDWTGWLRTGSTFPADLRAAMETCRPLWHGDGLQLDTWQTNGARVQCLFTVTPAVAPSFCANRAKGRLQHALRQAGTPVSFRGNVGFRTLGDNTRQVVERYIARQAQKSDYADPRFRDLLGGFTVKDGQAVLAAPYVGAHGRYWYNLHVVLVVADRRVPMTRHESFRQARDTCFRIAAKKGHTLAAVSVMPDHIHLALRGNIEHSPLEIGLGFLNNLAFVLGYNRCWSEEFYVGTFSEYDLRAVRGAH